MSENLNNKKKFQMPSALMIVTIFLMIVGLLTWFVPTSVVVDGEIIFNAAFDADGNVIGYVFATTSKSYGGDVSCMVGISCADNKITGVELTSINDTPGLGMKAKGEDFLNQYTGRSGNIGVNKNEKTDTEIKAISGATITSKAVTAAVNDAFGAYETIKAGGNNG
jgi:electron transport complex protein RnfG